MNSHSRYTQLFCVANDPLNNVSWEREVLSFVYLINVYLYIKLISPSPVSTPQYIIHFQYLVHSFSHTHRKHCTHQAISVPHAKYIQNILYGKTNKIYLPIPVPVKSANTPSASPPNHVQRKLPANLCILIANRRESPQLKGHSCPGVTRAAAL